MSLESYANAITSWEALAELAHYGFIDPLSALVTRQIAANAAVNTTYPRNRFADIERYLRQRESEVQFAADLFEDGLRAACLASGVGINYDRLGAHDACFAHNQYSAALSGSHFSDSGRDHKFPTNTWTRTQPTSPTGTKIFWLGFDENGHEIEAGFPGTTRFDVVTEPGSTAGRIAIDRIRSPQLAESWIEAFVEGLARGVNLRPTLDIHDRYTQGRIINPALIPTETSDNDPIATDELPNWTVGTADKYLRDAANDIRGAVYAVEVDAANDATAGNYVLTQPLPQLDRSKPYLPVILLDNTSSFVGTNVVTWGSKTFSVAHGAMSTSTTAHTLDLTSAAAARGCWPSQFYTDGGIFGHSLSALTSGKEVIQGLYLIEGTFDPFTGGWFFAVGLDTLPLAYAVGSMAHSIGGASKWQRLANLLGFLRDPERGGLSLVSASALTYAIGELS